MVTSFHVDSALVESTAQTVSSLAARLSADTASMLAQLEGVQQAWSGGAAQAFANTVAQWRATQQQVESSLVSIHEALAAAARQYAEVEAANLRMFSV